MGRNEWVSQTWGSCCADLQLLPAGRTSGFLNIAGHVICYLHLTTVGTGTAHNIFMFVVATINITFAAAKCSTGIKSRVPVP